MVRFYWSVYRIEKLLFLSIRLRNLKPSLRCLAISCIFIRIAMILKLLCLKMALCFHFCLKNSVLAAQLACFLYFLSFEKLSLELFFSSKLFIHFHLRKSQGLHSSTLRKMYANWFFFPAYILLRLYCTWVLATSWQYYSNYLRFCILANAILPL